MSRSNSALAAPILLLCLGLFGCEVVEAPPGAAPPGESPPTDADADGFLSDVDCDDTAADVFPGAEETCDGRDEDCSGAPDEGQRSWPDTDGDGFGDDAADPGACPPPEGSVLRGGDCDDAQAGVYPGAATECGGVDSDCDGVPETRLCSSCAEILAVGGSVGDGLYEVTSADALGFGGTFRVECDMTTDGGGWSLVQRTTSNGEVNAALLTDYATLWQDSVEPDPGGGVLRVAARLWEGLATQGDIMSVHELRRQDGSSCAPLRYALHGGSLEVAEPGEGTMTYTFTEANPHHVVTGSPAVLSATDAGPAAANCVVGLRAAPWFYVACSLSAPSVAGTFYPASAPRPVINDAALGAGLDGYDQSEACDGMPVERPVGGWTAENSHAYYLR